MHTLSASNDRFRKHLPSPRISHETPFKIMKPVSVVSSPQETKKIKKKPALKIAIVKNNNHGNNIIVDHVKTELVELIHSKLCDPDAEKIGGNNNITISARQCCFATPKSATFFTVKSATTNALNSLTKPFTPLLSQINSTPPSPTTTFELNSSNGGNSITSTICRGAADVAPTNFGSKYNFNFFEVTDIVSPVNAAHEYSLKLGELLASFSSSTTSVNTDSNKTLPVGAVPSQAVSTSKPEQLLPSENANSVSAMCITPARTHFLFSKIAGNMGQSAQQPTICEEPDIPEEESKIPLQDSLLSSLSALPSPPVSLEPDCAGEQPTILYEPSVIIGENQEFHQYQTHYQVELPGNHYFLPIIIPQQQQTMARDFAPLSSTPAYYNFQAHTTFFSPTFGVFPPPPHDHMQQINPEYATTPLQAGSYPSSQGESYFHEDQSVMVHHIQQLPYDHTYLSSMAGPGNETSYSLLSGSTSPCSSETYYESSIFSQNSPPTEDNYSNNNEYQGEKEEKSMQYAEQPEKRKKRKNSRENKAWTNPMVEAGLHVSLMHGNPLRVEKALPGKKGKYFCSHCKDQFRTILDLCEHMDAVSVRRPFHCPDTDCPWHVAGFPTASEWCRHTRFQHHRGMDQDAQKLGCESCGKKFTRKDSLKRHYILVHENENSRYNSKLRKLEECRFKKKKRRQQQRQRQSAV